MPFVVPDVDVMFKALSQKLIPTLSQHSVFFPVFPS